MIRLFEKPMPEKDFLQIKRLAVQLLAKKVDDLVEKWETEKICIELQFQPLSFASSSTVH